MKTPQKMGNKRLRERRPRSGGRDPDNIDNEGNRPENRDPGDGPSERGMWAQYKDRDSEKLEERNPDKEGQRSSVRMSWGKKATEMPRGRQIPKDTEKGETQKAPHR